MNSIMEDIIKYDKNDIRRDNNHKRDFFMRCVLLIISLLTILFIIYIYLSPYFFSADDSDKV